MDLKTLFETHPWITGAVLCYLLFGFMLMSWGIVESLEYPDYDPAPTWKTALLWIRSIVVIWVGWGVVLLVVILQMIWERIVDRIKTWAQERRASTKFIHTSHLI